MWYFTWILGIGLALAFGIVNVMWLEASYAFGHLDEDDIYNRFRDGGAPENQHPGGP
jgi:cyd operon protein YbgT